MAEVATEVIVAGHICLDIFPTFAADETGEKVLVPGKLVDVGPALLALGGAVANTGLALHRLGVATRLMGKVGDDLFGRAILDLVRSSGEALAQGMQVAPGAHGRIACTTRHLVDAARASSDRKSGANCPVDQPPAASPGSGYSAGFTGEEIIVCSLYI